MQKKSLVLSIAGIVVGMFCLAYAAVPLYSLFCRVTGFGGATQVSQALPGRVLEREVTIRFNADTAPNLPWEFASEQKEIKIRIGERALAFFSATNRSDKPITGTATYNVTPEKAGPYFNKIQCFCFNKQTLAPGEHARFPVTFYVDPAMAEDKNLNDIKTITLSYTFFRLKNK